MMRTPLALLVGLCLTAPSLANDLPYHQARRMVVIFSSTEPLFVQRLNGDRVEVLAAGAYRFDGTQRSRAALTPANFADGTGPFARYGSTVRGQITNLFTGTPVRDMSVTLELTDASFAHENIVRAGELSFGLRVRLDAMTSTQLNFKGQVARTGPFVPGTLTGVWAGQPGQVRIHHVKLALDDSQLPRRQPLESFPSRIEARVRPTPADVDGFEIEAGPYAFTLDRDALNAEGAAAYASAAHFPMVEESDYYGDYRSTPFPAEFVLQADGNVYLRLGWSLGGRYHGWSHNYVTIMSPADYETLLRDGRLNTTGTATFHYGGEDGVWDIETPMQIELRTTPVAPTAGMTSALPN